MKRGLGLLVVAGCMAGCATVDDYRRDVSEKKVFNDVPSAVKGIKPIATLTQERGVNIMVDGKKSPVVTLDGAGGGFELIAVDGKKGQEYDIELTSVCDCLGFRKVILYPISHMLDANGAIVSTAKISYLAGLGPIKMRLQGRFPADGAYLLMVAANNTEPSKALNRAWIRVDLPVVPIDLPATLRSAPEGEVTVIWDKPRK